MSKPSLTIYLLMVLLLLTTIVAYAQKKELSPGRISFSETMWDFGHVPKTGIVSHTYMIKNIGQDTLIIVKVRSSCGCTTTPLSQERLAPNQSVEMKVYFDPRKIVVDETTKKLQVVSSDPAAPIEEVQFAAKIGMNNSLVKFTPTEINFDTVVKGTEALDILTIENISGEKLSLKVIEGPGTNIDLDTKNKTIKPGERIQSILRLKKETETGELRSSLTLDFEGKKTTRVTIPIYGVIIGQ